MAGCETFYHRGVQHYAEAGAIGLICPDELHDGAPYRGGFMYRTFYPSAALMQEIAEDVAGRPLSRPPWFRHSVIRDPELMARLTELHASLGLDGRAASVLEQDTRLVDFLARLIRRWADVGCASVRPERGAVRRAQEYLDANLAEEVDLPRLAAVARLSRSHLIRAFRADTGLTPHAYLIDRRFRAASRLLGRGEAPVEVAAACGFFDQSHLNRVFKARMGVTPGAYRAA
jgi:AraC-like DNA-binding protein